MEFYQAIRDLLLKMTHQEEGLDLQHPLGSDNLPKREAVRFSLKNTLAFPEKEISRFIHSDGAGIPSFMEVMLPGLTGSRGVLPNHYTIFLIEQFLKKDEAAKTFFDLFNHRTISFFYRVWEKNRIYVRHERISKELDNLLAGFIGEVSTQMKGRVKISCSDLFYYTGLFIQRPRNSLNLEMLLRDYFKLPVTVQQFRLSRLFLNKKDKPLLVKVALGINSLLGESILSRQTCCRIQIGSLDYQEFEELLPTEKKLSLISNVTHLFIGTHIDLEFQLVLKGGGVPFCNIGNKKNRRLAWNTWLKSKEISHDVDDAVFSKKVISSLWPIN